VDASTGQALQIRLLTRAGSARIFY